VRNSGSDFAVEFGLSKKTAIGLKSITMLRLAKSTARTLIEEWNLPQAAREERMRDRKGLVGSDPGPQRVIDSCLKWLALAQDSSPTRDGGVARDYSLISGWSASYPETTGYIVPTFIDCAASSGRNEMQQRARLMLDWLVSIQFPDGGFQGGRIDSTPVVPVTFNTGQILLGLASGAREFGNDYGHAMQRAADWLVATIDDDGCWRKFPTPFASGGEKAYETHVAWGLFEAARIAPEMRYEEAALANVRWALGKQRENGWVEDCCLDDPSQPLTHTLGYFLRGVLEAYAFGKDPSLLEAARRTANGLLSAISDDGYLPGRLDANWTATVPWVCLTGTVQIAHCWLLLYAFTDDERYKHAAQTANRFVRRTINVTGPGEYLGGVKGSFPVDGDYGQYEFLNWAAKFCIDANIAEQRLTTEVHNDLSVPG
jgi:hypothetical protein